MLDDLVEVQADAVFTVFMGGLVLQVADKGLKLLQLLAEMVDFPLAVFQQPGQFPGGAGGALFQVPEFLPAFLLQEFQLHGKHLQRSIHQVNDAAHPAAGAGMAVITAQFVESPLQQVFAGGRLKQLLNPDQ
jgi:hypothetical protein